MRIVANFRLIPYTAVRAISLGDGRWQVYDADEAILELWPLTKLEKDALTAKEVQDANDTNIARVNAKVLAIAAMSPAQIETWVAGNVLTLLQARDVIATLGMVVSILARRL